MIILNLGSGGPSERLSVYGDNQRAPSYDDDAPELERRGAEATFTSLLPSELHFDRFETMESNEVVLALGALAQESRLSVYRLLVKRGPDGFNPSEISQRLEIPAPTLSFHLKELQRAGLVIARREGRYLHYSANFEQMNALLAFMTENCCSLADNACDEHCKPVSQAKRKRA